MDGIELSKALARLQSMRANLPDGDIQERDVTDLSRASWNPAGSHEAIIRRLLHSERETGTTRHRL